MEKKWREEVSRRPVRVLFLSEVIISLLEIDFHTDISMKILKTVLFFFGCEKDIKALLEDGEESSALSRPLCFTLQRPHFQSSWIIKAV